MEKLLLYASMNSVSTCDSLSTPCGVRMKGTLPIGDSLSISSLCEGNTSASVKGMPFSSSES